MKVKYLFIYLFIYLFMDFVFGLGVSPGKVEIGFKPNLETSFEMGVHNYPPKEYDVEIYTFFGTLDKDVIEEFRDVVILEKKIISFKKSEDLKTLDVDFKFPEGFSKGGVHELRVGAIPYSSGEGGITIKAGNEIRVLVNVPEQYVDEKYRIIKELKIVEINSKSVKTGEDADIEIKIKSESDIQLNDVYAVVSVLSIGREVKVLETDKISINPGEERTLNTGFNTKGLSGNLILNVEVFYGGDSTKGNGVLNVIGDSGMETVGITIVEKKFSIKWWWIIIGILIFLLLLIILLMFILLLKKREKGERKGKKKR